MYNDKVSITLHNGVYSEWAHMYTQIQMQSKEIKTHTQSAEHYSTLAMPQLSSNQNNSLKR